MNDPNVSRSTPPVADAGELTPAEQRATSAQVMWRLLPMLFVCYIIAYVDRINIGFAKLQLREALGVTPERFSSAYGLGAGLFFVGYFLLEVPSNLVLQRVGARIWIARIMIVWGLISVSFMVVSGTTMFYLLRFALGAAEAGFFPGVILYLTYWFPSRERARTIAVFAAGGILAGIVGAPISGALLELHGLGGLAGWQWLFLIEGVPAVLMGIVIFVALPNRPRDASWLAPRQRDWIEARLAADATGDRRPALRLAAIFVDRRVWLLCLLYFLLNVGGYGYELWLPTIVTNLSGLRSSLVGVISAVPYLGAGIAMILVAQHSDRTGERRRVLILAAVASALGFALSAVLVNAWLAMAALTLAFIGLKCTVAPFWAMVTAYLSSGAAAAGVAFINSVGNLGGFVGPYLVGVIKDQTHSNVVALLVLGASLLAMAVFTVWVPKAATGRAK